MAGLVPGVDKGGVAVYRLSNNLIVLAGVTVDGSGDIVAPATEGKQDDGNTILTAIQAATEKVRTVDADNSTTDTLGNGGVFTGDWVDGLGYTEISVQILTDQDSATNGLRVEHSSTGNADEVSHAHPSSVAANSPTGVHALYSLTDRYYRIKYTNGATPQTVFNLKTIQYKGNAEKAHTHPIELVIDGNHPAPINRTILTAKRADNAYANIRSTNGDELKISFQSMDGAISSNSETQLNVTQFLADGTEGTKITDGSESADVVLNDDKTTNLDGTNGLVTDAVLYGRVSDSIVKPVRTDSSTETLMAISYEHHEVHGGTMFSICDANDLGNAAVRDLLIVTPDTTKWAHLVIQIESESETDYLLYEGTTTSDDGTGLTEYNRNRNSATAATTAISHTPTVSGVGTLVCHLHWGAGRGTGGGDRSSEEWILKQNTKYLLRITNATTTNNYVSTKLVWYEHTDRN